MSKELKEKIKAIIEEKTMEDGFLLLDSAAIEIESLMVKEKTHGWFDGENLKSSVNYYAAKKEVYDKVKFIRFMGHTGKYEGDLPQMSLYIRFKDGTDKWFLCEQNEDGSFPSNVFDVVLRKADEYLGTLQTESLVV